MNKRLLLGLFLLLLLVANSLNAFSFIGQSTSSASEGQVNEIMHITPFPGDNYTLDIRDYPGDKYTIDIR